MSLLLLNLSLMYYLTGWKIFRTLGKIFVWFWVVEQVALIGIAIGLLSKLF